MTMEASKATHIRRGITELVENLQCPICLDIMMTPVSTKCDHLFCKFCMMKLIDGKKQNRADCPVCKSKITKRSLQESPGFQRLVAGLQQMIQAYEQDSILPNCLVIPNQKRQSKVADTEITEEPHSVSKDHTSASALQKNINYYLPPSHSSTVAAQRGFARLMALEDSSPEIEGQDSGLGDVPLDSNQRSQSPITEFLETMETEASVVENKMPKVKEIDARCGNSPSGPKVERTPLLRRSSRNKKREDAVPDSTLNKKHNQSVNKVADWLLQVPLLSGDTNSEKTIEDKFDSEDSDSGSSTSEMIVRQHSVPKGVERPEDVALQVFGAVYTRKKSGNQTNPPLQNMPANPINNVSTETSNAKHCQRQRRSNLQQYLFEDECDPEEKLQLDIAGKDTQQRDVDICDGRKNVDQESNGFDTRARNDKDEVVQIWSEPEARQPERKSKATHNSHQLVDSDLQEQTKAVVDGAVKRKTVETKGRPNRGKSARVSEPLVLVSAQKTVYRKHNQKGALQTRTTSEDLHGQIENYPDSDEQGVVDKKTIRRSSRLRQSATEIQGSVKKFRTPAELKMCAPSTEGCVRFKEDDAATEAETFCKKKDTTQRNECIFDKGVVIETPEHNTAVPALLEHYSTRPTRSASVDFLPESYGQKNQSQNSCHVATFQFEMEDKEKSVEEKNDSELDTEQLLRSFKTATRKSFHFGGPHVKRSNLSSDTEGQHGEENRQLDSEPEDTKGIKESNVQEVPKSVENSDVILSQSDTAMSNCSTPNGNEQRRDLAVSATLEKWKPGQDNSSISSSLSPNKVSVVPEGADPGLPVIVAVVEDLITEVPVSFSQRLSRECLSEMNENLATAESLTPSVLLTPSPVKTRKRRRIQRLESSEESVSSSSEGREELPPLNEILGPSVFSSAVDPGNCQDKESLNQTGHDHESSVEEFDMDKLSHPPLCYSPDLIDASQVSLDLFGTPKERHISKATESSELSSEIPSTQQKIEMQNELLRLEKLISLVSEVLREKEAGTCDALKSRGDTVEDGHKSATCDQNRGETSGQSVKMDGRNVQPSSRQGSSDSADVSKPCSSKHARVTDGALQCSTNEEPVMKGDSLMVTKPSANPQHVKGLSSDGQEDKENNVKLSGMVNAPVQNEAIKLVLVTSGLHANEQVMVKRFARRVGAHVASCWTPEVTHVIMHTDGTLVCERTLKYFLGIAGRKWVVSFHWISECLKLKKLVDESPFEVRGDVVNGSNHQGPMKARTTREDQLLFRDYSICFQGSFTNMTTDDMEWMVKLCGAVVVKDPHLLDSKQKSHQLVIVQAGLESSLPKCKSLFRQAAVVSRGWLLDSVATYTVQKYSNYNHAA